MKKTLLTLMCVSFLFSTAFSENWERSTYLTSNIALAPFKSVIDQDNNTIALGSYIGNINGNQQITPGLDYFLVSYNQNLDLNWSRTFNNPAFGGKFTISPSISLAPDNSIYVTGRFSNKLYYTNNESQLDSLVADSTNWDIFIGRINQDGSLNFIKTIGTNPADQFDPQVDIVDDGSTIITMQYRDSIRILDTTLYGDASTNFVVVKTCPLCLEIDWINNYDNPTDIQAKSLNVLGNDIYITGSFTETVTLAGRTLESENSISNLFIYKLDINGTPKWSRQTLMKSTGSTAQVYNAVKDISGNLYFGGSYTSDTFFIESSSDDVDKSTQTAGGEDMFLVKYNPEGNLQFIKSFGHTNDDRLRNIDYRNDILYITGFYTDFFAFGSDTLITDDQSEWEFFLGALDMDGNPLMINGVQTYSASDQRDMGISISINEKIQAHVLGIFRSDSIHFTNEGYAKQGVQDMFVGIYQPKFTAVFTDITDPTCSGSTDGQLKVAGYFGVPPYAYEWSHNASLETNLAKNLADGAYSVTITDQRDSSAVVSVTLNEPTALNMSSKTVNDVSCYNGNNGSINILVSGGTPFEGNSYQYAWKGTGSGTSASSEDQSDLSAGQFCVTVTDAQGCKLKDTSSVSEPAMIRFSDINVRAVTSEGAADGAVLADVTGGTPSYSYEWEGEEPLTFTSTQNDSITDLSGGLYYLTITDSEGCVNDTFFVVNESGVLIASIDSVHHITCLGDQDGFLRATTQNATDPLNISYHWEGPDSFSADTNAINNLAGGTYRVTVAEGSDTAYASFTIKEATSNLLMFTSRTHVKCYGNSTGIIDLIVLGGISPYQYEWSNDAVTEDLSNIQAGTYHVTVTDKHGCEGTISNITIDQPAQALGASISFEQIPSCFDANDGALRVTPSGGTGTKTYQWNDPANLTSQVANNLTGNKSYSVTVTDQNNCRVIQSNFLPAPEELELSNVILETVDNMLATDGRIDVITSGGTSPITYTLYPNETSNQTGTFTNLGIGEYLVTAIDANSCKTISTDTLVISYLHVTDTTLTMPLCHGDSNGVIAITVDGNAGSFSYSWENITGSGTDDADQNNQVGLSAGSYRVSITDQAGSLLVEDYTLTQADSLKILNIETNPVSEATAKDGSITVEATGGTGTYTYELNDTASNESGIFENLSAGDYQIVVTDENSCQVISDTTTVTFTSFTAHVVAEGKSLLAYPIPAQDILTLEIDAEKNKTMSYTLTNTKGQKTQNGQMQLQKGQNKVTLDVSTLPTGLYILQLQNTKFKQEATRLSIQIQR